jgi:membrane protease YdiL (CAAX protease family)
MGSRPFANADPFLQIIVLFLLSFFCVGLFILMGQGLLNVLWGVDLFENPQALQDVDNPQVVNMSRVLLVFQHLGLFVIPAILFSKLTSNEAWHKAIGFKPAPFNLFVASILVMVMALPLINLMAHFNESIGFPETLSGLEEVFAEMEESAQKLTMAIAGTTEFAVLLLNILIIAVLPALGEEMIFRGLLLPIIRRWTNSKHLAVWISAFLFSAFHLQFYGFLPRLVLGALLGYLFIWTKSLWAPVLAHFVNNALALVLIFMITKGYIEEDVDSFEQTLGDWIWVLVSLVGVGLTIFYLLLNRREDKETS